MGFVSFMILIWDHIITLGDEVRLKCKDWPSDAQSGYMQVEYIWKGRKKDRGTVTADGVRKKDMKKEKENRVLLSGK